MNKNLLIVLAFLLFNIIGYGQKTWTGATSTSWDVSTNWSPAGKPINTDNVIITNATNQPLITSAGASCAKLELRNSTSDSNVVLTVKGLGTFSCESIVMNSSGGNTSNCSLNINTGNNRIISVSGNITMNGNALQNDVTFSGDGNLQIGGVMTGGTLNADGKGTVAFNGTGTRNVGEYNYNNLIISGSGIRTITPGVIVNGLLIMEGTAAVSAAPTYGADAGLQYTTATFTVGPEWVSPFIANGGIQIAGTPSFPSLITMGSSVIDKKISDGVKLIIEQGCSLKLGATKLYLGGDFINNNGSLITDGLVYLTGDVDQSIDGFSSSAGVSMTKNAGIATFTGNINTKNLIINGLGSLNLGSGLTHTFTEWTRTQGTLNAGSSILKVSGDVIDKGGNFNAGTSTVEFNGGTQNLGNGSIIYNNLKLSGTGTKTFGAQTTINETFSIVDGVVADLTANLVHTAKSIKLGLTAGAGGSWGSSLSNAINKNDTFFISNNGIVNVGPTIVISTTSLAAFTTTYGTSSTTKSFNISGLAMLEGILVTAPTGFEVSTDGTTFSNTLTIGAAGAIASKTIYVRLKGTVDAGDYSGNIALTSNGTTTINVAIANSTVNKAVLKVIPDDKGRTYGDDNPTLTVTYSGFKNNDDEAVVTTRPIIRTTAVKTSSITTAVNKYEITVTGAESLNYTFDYTKKGELTINPAVLTITVEKAERERGAADPTFVLSYSDFKNDESADVFTKPPRITTTADQDSPVGNYDILVDSAEALNYTFVYIKGNLEVLKSSNDNLIGLALSEGTLSPAFAEGTKDYIATVENNVTTVTVTPTASDSKAKIWVNDVEVISGTASQEIDLKVGENVIKTTVVAENGTESTYEVTVTRKPSDEARLSDLVINGVDLNTPFDKDKEENKANVPNENTSVVITPTPMEPNATVKMFVDGVEVTDLTAPIDLKVGANEITYVVTAQDGTTIKDYTVIVNRADVLSNDASLTDLVISDGKLEPDFSPEILKYDVTVKNDVTDITLTPITSDPAAKVVINGKEIPSGTPSDKLPLEVGENEIKTVVTAEDGTINTYTVIVTREPSNNADLANIIISKDTLDKDFDKDNTGYKVDVPYETDSFVMNPIPFDPNAKVEVIIDGKVIDPTAPIDFKVGDNEIKIVVTAEDGVTQKEYTVIVTREEEMPSNDAGLADIVISDGTLSPTFNTDTNDYRVEVSNDIDTYVIKPLPIDPNANVVVIVDGKTIDPTAPIDLNVGENVITIVVTAEDGTTQGTYTVVVVREDAVPQVIVPSNIITPNGDGKNDFWVVPGLDQYPNNSVKVFDKAARLLYSKDNYNNDWDGTFKGSPVNEDTYYYLIDLGNGSPKLKGFISILRN